MGKDQLSTLISENAKPKPTRLSWSEMSKIVNAEGPSIKTATQWQKVNIEQSYCAN